MPGTYSVSVSLFHNGEIKQIAGTVKFNAEVLKNTTLPAGDRAELVAFQKKSMKLTRVIMGSQKYAEMLLHHMQVIKQTLYDTPAASDDLIVKADKINNELRDILFAFNGEKPKASAEEVPPSKVSLNSRLGTLIWTHWRSTAGVTENERTAYKVLTDEFPPVYNKLKNYW